MAIRRREFISFLGGAAQRAAWAARAEGERVRNIGVLLPATADDPVFQARLAAFYQELALPGWSIGRNVRIDVRWATTNPAGICRHAAELAALNPDVILSTGDFTAPPLLQATRTVPIVFPVVNDHWAPATSRASRAPAATSPDLCFWKYSRRRGNGWSCSRRSR